MIGWLLWCAVALAAPLTLDDVLQAVDERLPQLVAASAEIEAAEARLLASRGAFDPRVTTASVGYLGGKNPRRYGEAALSVATPLGPSVLVGWRQGDGDFPLYDGYRDTLDLGEARVGVSVPLLDGLGMSAERAKLLLARQGLDGAVARRSAQAVRLRNDAAKAWWRWAGAGARLAIEVELLALAESRQEAMARQIAEGALARLDGLDAERVLYDRRARAVGARQDVVIAAQALSLWVRAPSGAPIVPEPEDLPPLVAPDAAPGDDDLAEGLAARPDLAVLDVFVAQGRLQVARAANARLPSVDAFAQVSQDRGHGEVEPAELFVGFKADVPLLLREGRGEHARAVATLDRLLAERRLLADQVAVEVASAQAGIVRAQERLAALEASAERAAEAARLGWRAFELGATDLFIALAREERLADARRAVIDARVEQGWAVADLRAALGR